MDKLLLIDDEDDVRYSFKRIFSSPDLVLETAASGEEGIEVIKTFKPDLVLMDVRMGGISGLETLRIIREDDAKLPIIMMTAFGTTQTAIEAMKLGAYDYLLKPFDVPKLKQIVNDALKAARDMKQVVACEPLLESEDYDMGIVGRSQSMQEVFKTIGQLAGSDATALITGESGTGKELVARAIYHNSQRNSQSYLPINCAAIPENLLESELFGHEKGAFTGATSQRIGKFEQCHQGTLFLDEIGDMTLATQAKILRVLQNGTIERVGGNKSINVDVRIIAATNKKLEEAVAENEFREDLFYRLNVVRVSLPPLRKRSEDIPLLIDYFLKVIAESEGSKVKSILETAQTALLNYSWPGNVRELENVIRRTIVMAKGDAIRLDDLPANVYSKDGIVSSIENKTFNQSEPPVSPVASNDISSLAATLFQWAKSQPDLAILPAVERELVAHALRETNGNQVQASKLLGITRATLRNRIDKFGIKQAVSVQ
ncbi:MAG: sigma-54 dependent transcriptional regulator [Verrucomicrobiota bacterium]|jgi:two-component system nitrogen regulation response regulator GlnG|nr:sigma-54 dependent transcriptional regulator [Verrucomicrobiota bacterium]